MCLSGRLLAKYDPISLKYVFMASVIKSDFVMDTSLTFNSVILVVLEFLLVSILIALLISFGLFLN